MAFFLYTVVFVVLIFGLVLMIYGQIVCDDSLPLAFLFFVSLCAVVTVYVISTCNRFEVKQDVGIVTVVAQLRDGPNQMKVELLDDEGTRIATCALKSQDLCSQLHPGTPVVTDTEFNSVGFIEKSSIVGINP